MKISTSYIDMSQGCYDFTLTNLIKVYDKFLSKFVAYSISKYLLEGITYTYNNFTTFVKEYNINCKIEKKFDEENALVKVLVLHIGISEVHSHKNNGWSSYGAGYPAGYLIMMFTDEELDHLTTALKLNANYLVNRFDIKEGLYNSL